MALRLRAANRLATRRGSSNDRRTQSLRKVGRELKRHPAALQADARTERSAAASRAHAAGADVAASCRMPLRPAVTCLYQKVRRNTPPPWAPVRRAAALAHLQRRCSAHVQRSALAFVACDRRVNVSPILFVSGSPRIPGDESSAAKIHEGVCARRITGTFAGTPRGFLVRWCPL